MLLQLYGEYGNENKPKKLPSQLLHKYAQAVFTSPNSLGTWQLGTFEMCTC